MKDMIPRRQSSMSGSSTGANRGGSAMYSKYMNTNPSGSVTETNRTGGTTPSGTSMQVTPTTSQGLGRGRPAASDRPMYGGGSGEQERLRGMAGAGGASGADTPTSYGPPRTNDPTGGARPNPGGYDRPGFDISEILRMFGNRGGDRNVTQDEGDDMMVPGGNPGPMYGNDTTSSGRSPYPGGINPRRFEDISGMGGFGNFGRMEWDPGSSRPGPMNGRPERFSETGRAGGNMYGYDPIGGMPSRGGGGSIADRAARGGFDPNRNPFTSPPNPFTNGMGGFGGGGGGGGFTPNGTGGWNLAPTNVPWAPPSPSRPYNVPMPNPSPAPAPTPAPAPAPPQEPPPEQFYGEQDTLNWINSQLQQQLSGEEAGQLRGALGPIGARGLTGVQRQRALDLTRQHRPQYFRPNGGGTVPIDPGAVNPGPAPPGAQPTPIDPGAVNPGPAPTPAPEQMYGEQDTLNWINSQLQQQLSGDDIGLLRSQLGDTSRGLTGAQRSRAMDLIRQHRPQYFNAGMGGF